MSFSQIFNVVYIVNNAPPLD